ncbi:MAG: pyridoxamine 5'-phosphate oxidase family protein [Patescibacteria group bacterium]|nr:pyridoxamine 5'-phosphate oxidase family protein [Patescibacteria group bacterium]
MKMINNRVKKLIESEAVAVSTVMPNGNPNIIGVACVKVVGVNQVLITDNYMNQTVKDILNNPRVVLAVWNKKWEGYKLLGKAQYFDKGKWLERVKKMPENKKMPAKGAILVSVDRVIKAA